MKKNDSQELLLIFGLVFIIPIALGLVLYGLFQPVKFALRALWQSSYFWIALLVLAIAALLFDLSTHCLTDFVLRASEFRGVDLLLQLPYLKTLPISRLLKLEKYFEFMFALSPVVAFVIIPKLRKKAEQEKIGTRKVRHHDNFKPKDFEKGRSSNKGAFLGFDKQTKEPVYVSKYELGMHTQVIGSTGFGKTASVLLSRIDYDLRAGHGMIFIDGKGDLESYCQFLALVDKTGRRGDLRVFSPVMKSNSCLWNPLIRGTPTKIKDRLIGSQIWSEEFYKKKGEEVILTLLNAFDDLQITPSFKKLERLLEDPDYAFNCGKKFTCSEVEQKFKKYQERFKADVKNYGGLASDISLISCSDFGKLFEAEPGKGIDLLEAYQKNQIVYFHLPVLGMEESAKRIGRMVIHDLKTVCAHVQLTTMPGSRNYFPVYIDEFASFAGENFIELLNKARSAGVAITILHQSLGDLQTVSENFARQIIENTNCKIMLHLDDNDTLNTYSGIIGTRASSKYTYQVQSDLFSMQKSGGASLREVEEYIVHPNDFRDLKVGHGIIYIKSSKRIHHVKFDQINPDISRYNSMALNEMKIMPRKEILQSQKDLPSKNYPEKQALTSHIMDDCS